MGIWSAEIFGNDRSCDIKDEFFERYNRGEEPSAIKHDLLPSAEDEDRLNSVFALAYCMWETGSLEPDFLLAVKQAIESKEDLELAKELGADDAFLKHRNDYLTKFLEKISVTKVRLKKRVAPPIPVESKYRNGAVMAFQYPDGSWGALLSLNGRFFDKETHYAYIQTTVKTFSKPTMDDVRRSYLIDINFHNAESNSWPHRSPQFYDSFDHCIAEYLPSRATKKFESYNDSFLEIIGYLSDWGKCNSGIYSSLEYDKTVDEFQAHAGKLLMAGYDKKADFHTDMTVGEIDQEFISRKKQNG